MGPSRNMPCIQLEVLIMNTVSLVKDKLNPSVGYKITISFVTQKEIFDTFEEAFISLHGYINSRHGWNLDELKDGLWIEQFNKDSGETINTKDLFDCMDFAKKMGLRSVTGELIPGDYSAISNTVNKCFSKSIPQEYLEKI